MGGYVRYLTNICSGRMYQANDPSAQPPRCSGGEILLVVEVAGLSFGIQVNMTRRAEMELFQYEPDLGSRQWVDIAGSITVCCSL